MLQDEETGTASPGGEEEHASLSGRRETRGGSFTSSTAATAAAPAPPSSIGGGRRGSVHSATSSRRNSALTYEEILANDDEENRMCPLNRTNFVKYLERTHALENLLFLEAVEKFKSSRDATTRAREAQNIVNRFIRVNAEQEINISSHMRARIMEDYQTALRALTFDSGMFAAAATEIGRMLRLGAFPQFVEEKTKTNLSIENVRWRYVLVLLLLMLNVAVITVICVSPINSCTKLVLLPSWYGVFSQWYTARTRV
jgi:hypothetical protein